MVTVICLTYNHENYIRQCLEGFVAQQTTFPFEVIVCDDASTDATPLIIAEYAATYPGIIKPVLQAENQFSRGQDARSKLWHGLFQGARGKYVALCEGDDWWSAPDKLQLQADFLEAHPDYGMCFHDADFYDDHAKAVIGRHNRYPADTDVSAEDLIMGSGNFCPTNSLCMRRALCDAAPAMVFSQYVGDYPLQMYFGLVSKVRYMARSLSVYRVNTTASWTQRTYSAADFAAFKPVLAGEMALYRDFTACFPQYEHVFERKKNRYLAYYCAIYGQYAQARKAWMSLPWADRDKSVSMLMRLWGPPGLYDRIKALWAGRRQT